MGNRPKAKMRGVSADRVILDELQEGDIWDLVDAHLATNTAPIVGRTPTNKEKQMNAQSPVTVVTENDPTEPEATIVTARFNRQKLIRFAGAAAAVAGVVAIVFAVGKSSGREQALDEVESLDDSDEPKAS